VKAETAKTKTCTRLIFDRGGNRPIIRGPWQRPCLTESIARAGGGWSGAGNASTAREMSRPADLLATRAERCTRGLRREIGFRPCGRPGVAVEATPRLVCSVVCKASRLPPPAAAEIEFSNGSARARRTRRARCMRRMRLGDLTRTGEEELLLALPIVAMPAPQTSRRAATGEAAAVRTCRATGPRPFAALQDLFKEKLIGHSTHGQFRKKARKTPSKRHHRFTPRCLLPAV